MKTIEIKNQIFGDRPRVLGIIVDTEMGAPPLKRFVDRGIDILEIRADLCGRPMLEIIDYINNTIKKSMPEMPLVGTVRKCEMFAGNYVDAYIKLAEHVDVIDMDIDMGGLIKEIIDMTRGIGAAPYIMLSQHDFEKTPNIDTLNDTVKRALDSGAQIVKIATMANCYDDVARLMKFTYECDVPVVTMAMGDVGKITRIIAPLYGSLFAYGYLRKPLVPGQLAALRILDVLNAFSLR